MSSEIDSTSTKLEEAEALLKRCACLWMVHVFWVACGCWCLAGDNMLPIWKSDIHSD